ncbi:hypothetical protein [Rhodohalobacter sp.]|uniref:hypothetical protein n=1 Tax=Rhodohalobacter sp. TaxID=1974210 RepID=UPI002ACE9845|nr:hypothetical protein [Rhodohalobacter sp.]MDZ7757162.1 hypothetical protein [Rhodohalobacter sp.]
MVTNRPFLLRFLFLYVLFYTSPFPLDQLGILYLRDIYELMWIPVIDWVGNLFITINIADLGIGPDTPLEFILALVFAVLSALGALVWTRFDTSDKKVTYWFFLYLRLYLGLIMFTYGIGKILPLQMHHFPLSRLLVTIGDSDTWGLTWNFMAFGRGYEIFTGLVEAVGGILLFHRRTRLLGGLILIGALINVVAINLFYGVPVKLFASHLLLFSILIVLPDSKRIFNFLANNPVESLDEIRPDFSKRQRLFIDSTKWIFVTIAMFLSINYSLSLVKEMSDVPLFGIYEVDKYVLNGEEVPPLATDSVRLKYMVIDNNYGIQMIPMDGDYKLIPAEIDTINQKIAFKESLMGEDSLFIDYNFRDRSFELRGVTGEDSLFITGQILTEEDFRINQNRFYLIRTHENTQHNTAWPRR